MVALAVPTPAHSMGIVATVNSTPISEYDLRARLEMVIALAGLPRTQDTARQLAPKLVETLIEEELKRQEAKSLGIEVSEADVERAVRRLEQARRMPAGGVLTLLEQIKVPKEVLYQNVRADLAWSRILRQRFRALTQVSEAEVDEELARMEADKGKPVALLSEIFLPVDQPDKEAEIRQVAERLVQELKAGAQFPALAATFSQSPTAAIGGDQGWVSLSTLQPPVRQALEAMKPGELSLPIRTQQGYLVLWLRDQRVSQGASGPAVDPRLVIQQVTIPVAETADSSQVNARLELAKRLKLRSESCDAMAELPKQVSGGLTADRNGLRLSQLSPLVREAIKDLPDKKASDPVKVPGAFLLFMICSREEENSKDLLRREVRNRLIDDRLDLAARQYLRDIKRNAFIERRR